MTTGQRIAQKRKEAGLSQETLGAEPAVHLQVGIGYCLTGD